MSGELEIPLERIDVRKLEKTEVDRIVPIYLDVFHGMTNPEMVRQWLQCNLRAFPLIICFGAWYDSSLLGYIIWTEKGAFRKEAVWELEQIAVLSQYRRQGIGSKLINKSLMEVKDHLTKRHANLKLVMVTTGIANESKRLYERALGAKKHSIIKDFYEGDEQIMIARPDEGNLYGPKDDEILLRLEYAECQTGYNSRDKIVPDEARYVAFIFGALTAILIFANDVLSGHPTWFRIVASGTGVMGFVLLLGFLTDIQSNLTCKRALRKRSEEIENLLSPVENTADPKPPLSIWRYVIPKRAKYWGESRLKNIFPWVTPEGEGNHFVVATWAAIVIWIALIVACLVIGPGLKGQ